MKKSNRAPFCPLQLQRILIFFCVLLGTSYALGQNWQNYGFSATDLEKAPKEQKTHKILAEIASLMRAYPLEISSVQWRNNDWVFTFANGQKLYWAQGRLLPKAKRAQAALYRAYISYRYVPILKDPSTLSKHEIKRIKQEGLPEKRGHVPVYEGSFYEILYNCTSRKTLEAQLVPISFLGWNLSVHKKVKTHLVIIDNKIRALAKTNASVKTFMQELRSVQSYTWRKIRGSTNISFHSLGLAIDILPKNKQKIVFWGWEAARNEEWPLVPFKKRWIPPKEVIDIFAEQGFIWGGYWSLYDNMHFEYRPELLVLHSIHS